MIVLDVDGVLVPRGTIIHQDEDRLELGIKKIGQHEIDSIKELYNQGYEINIASGRSLFLLMMMFRNVMDYVSFTYENGSATWYKGDIIQHINSYDDLKKVRKELSQVESDKIKGWEPKEFIITIHATDRVKEIESIVDKYDNIQCLWNGEAYDIMRDVQTKAKGIDFLGDFLGFDTDNFIVIGDNLNDREMMEKAGISISSDYRKVEGDYYIPMPASILIDKICEINK